MARRQRRARKVQMVERLGIREKTFKERARELGLWTFLVKPETLKKRVDYLTKLAEESAEKKWDYLKVQKRMAEDRFLKPTRKNLDIIIGLKFKILKSKPKK